MYAVVYLWCLMGLCYSILSIGSVVCYVYYPVVLICCSVPSYSVVLLLVPLYGLILFSVDVSFLGALYVDGAKGVFVCFLLWVLVAIIVLLFGSLRLGVVLGFSLLFCLCLLCVCWVYGVWCMGWVFCYISSGTRLVCSLIRTFVLRLHLVGYIDLYCCCSLC